MKKYFFIVILSMLLISCSKKTHPSVEHERTIPTNKKNITTSSPTDPTNATAATMLPASPLAAASMLVIIDGAGNIITSKEKLPQDIAEKTDYTKLERAFTPAQKANLVSRFKAVPPRVLYVPDQYINKSTRGYYTVYKKKFWYWKKSDGLFYLDETYYR